MNTKRLGLRELHHELSRRDFLRVAASAGAVGAGAVLLGGCGSDVGKGGPTSTPGIVVDPPPETTTIRLPKDALLPRLAPLYLAEQFLPAEGFTDVQYIDLPYITPDLRTGHLQRLATGELDIGLVFAHSFSVAADAGEPLVALAGVQTSVFVLFGNDGVQSLRDLKGKRLFVYSAAASDPAYAFWAALLAYVGIDVEHEVETVELSGNIFAEAQAGNVDAWTVLPPHCVAVPVGQGRARRPRRYGRPTVVAVLRSYGNGKQRLRREAPGCDEAGASRHLEGNRCVREGTGARRPLPRGQRLHGAALRFRARWHPRAVVRRLARIRPEDTVRFYALRLKEAGLVKSTPDELIARATDWRYLNEIKRELGVA